MPDQRARVVVSVVDINAHARRPTELEAHV